MHLSCVLVHSDHFKIASRTNNKVHHGPLDTSWPFGYVMALFVSHGSIILFIYVNLLCWCLSRGRYPRRRAIIPFDSFFQHDPPSDFSHGPDPRLLLLLRFAFYRSCLMTLQLLGGWSGQHGHWWRGEGTPLSGWSRRVETGGLGYTSTIG